MKLCENCIHANVCGEKNKVCQNFKDKSFFIELPCAVGTAVYVIEACQCYSKNHAARCANRLPDSRNRALLTVKVRPEHKPESTSKCLKLFERPFKLEYMNRIGKSVFLSFEEAKSKITKKEEG